ncbi:9309_t:CDS:1, partial [Gigaspora rosea]
MSSSEVTNISASTTDKGKKNIGGRPYGPVWEYFTKGEKVVKGRYKATCNLCGTIWNRGKPIELKSHLANYCTKAVSLVIRKFLTRILSN